MMWFAPLAALATALFTGGAIYVSLVEHPARMACSVDVAVAQWRPSYKRATVMQASLAVVGTLAGIGAGIAGAGPLWVIAGFVLSAVVPFTLFVMWPTNKRLEDSDLDASSDDARALLARWGNLHAVRSALGLIALLLMLLARS